MVDARTCTCESFERLIWVRVVLSAENGLNRLCHYSPVSFKVSTDSIFVKDELAESLLEGVERNHRMCERHADVAENSRVGKVTLQTRDRQFHRKMSVEGICHSEVTFGILEVDRVHLVRHSR